MDQFNDAFNKKDKKAYLESVIEFTKKVRAFELI